VGDQGIGTLTVGSYENWPNLAVTGDMIVGNSSTGNGSVYLYDGNVNVSGTMTVGNEGIGTLQVGGNGSEPSLTVGDYYNPKNMVVGNTAAGPPEWNGTYQYHGLVTQQDGYVTVYGNLVLGQNGDTGNGPAIGVYELNDGTLSVGNNAYIGYDGSGTFTQNGGTHMVGYGLVLGRDAGSSGTYNLNDGSLSAAEERIGREGSGTFNQTGGSNTVDDGLIVGRLVGSNGAYNLSGGSLTVNGNYNDSHTSNLTIGDEGIGTLTVTNPNNYPSSDPLYPTITVGNDMIVGNVAAGLPFIPPGSTFPYWQPPPYHGKVDQYDGQVTVNGSLVLGQNGDTGNGPAYGVYNLNGGSLSVGNNLFVGDAGIGFFIQTGGSVSVTNDLIVGNQMETGAPPSGLPDINVYTLSNGSLTVGRNLVVANEGMGAFTNADGGNLHVYGNLTVGANNNQYYNAFLQWAGTAASSTQIDGQAVFGDLGLGYGVISGGSFTVGGSGNPQNLILGNQDNGTSNPAGAEFHMDGGIDAAGKATLTVWGDMILGNAHNTWGYFFQPDPTGTTHVYGDLIVGNAGKGKVQQSGGTTTVEGNLVVGRSAGSAAGPNEYDLSSTGVLNAGAAYVADGSGAKGVFNLSDTAQLNILSTGGNVEVGRSGGDGKFYQSGGSLNTNNNYVMLARGATSTGYYELSGGSIDTGALSVGFEGTGNFKMTGGTLTAGYAEIGVINGSIGSMVQSGGDVTITQTGHPSWAGGMTIGRDYGSTGSYEINQNNGTATLTTGSLEVGSSGQGTFTQKAGTVTVANALNIGTDPTGTGSYTMSGGTLSTKDLTVGSTGSGTPTGSLALTNAAVNVTVSHSFTIAAQGQFTAASDVTINMTGSSFYNYSTDPNNVDMTQLRMLFSNPVSGDTFEVAGHDYGASLLGFTNNFALGTLELTAGAKLDLVDNFSNLGDGTEALYVYTLILGPGAVLDPDIDLYYVHLYNDGGIFGGGVSPQQVGQVVPLPSTLLLLASGLGGLALLRRRILG
jgi:fibronectin-binding autotransporter adhesin